MHRGQGEIQRRLVIQLGEAGVPEEKGNVASMLLRASEPVHRALGKDKDGGSWKGQGICRCPVQQQRVATSADI